MIFDFLTPVDAEIPEFVKKLSSHQFGNKIKIYTKDKKPDLDTLKIVLIGVGEDRGDGNIDTSHNMTDFRKEIYSLYPGNWNAEIADLGDILSGETYSDTFFALKTVVSHLVKKNIIPIIIGGTQDLTYPIYRAYDDLEQMVNLVAIDSKFDFGGEEDTITASSYLGKIIIDEPNNLFNYSNIGYQTYLNSQEEIDLIEKLYFDAYRLGDVLKNISIAEHIFRDADIVSLDLNAIKSANSGNFIIFKPNGFDGKEICTLSRYSGISDKVSVFGIFNHKNLQSEFILIAQIVWYFIDGYHYRTHEYPFGSKENYLKFIVPLEEETLIFYKSNKTDRWWIEIPTIIKNPNGNKSTLLPCSHEEYLAACNQEMPPRWLKSQRKNII